MLIGEVLPALWCQHADDRHYDEAGTGEAHGPHVRRLPRVLRRRHPTPLPRREPADLGAVVERGQAGTGRARLRTGRSGRGPHPAHAPADRCRAGTARQARTRRRRLACGVGRRPARRQVCARALESESAARRHKRSCLRTGLRRCPSKRWSRPSCRRTTRMWPERCMVVGAGRRPGTRGSGRGSTRRRSMSGVASLPR